MKRQVDGYLLADQPAALDAGCGVMGWPAVALSAVDDDLARPGNRETTCKPNQAHGRLD